MLTSSIPVAGIVVALFAAAASVSATALTSGVLAGLYSPVHIGLLYLPEVGGAVVSAVALGLVIRRRAMHYLPLVGMILLAAGIAVFRIEVPSSQALTLVGSGLTGLGLGATVAPALFVAGFSLPAANLQRVFAIVELFRAVAAFMVAPIFVHFAVDGHRQPRHRHRHRPVDRARARSRWRRHRCRHLRAQRRTPADARPRPLPRPDRASVVLATAAGESSLEAQPLATLATRKRRLTWHRLRQELQHQPVRSSSPTTAPSWRRSRSSKPRGSLRSRARRPGPLRLAAGRRRICPDEQAALRRRPGLRSAEGRGGNRRLRSIAGSRRQGSGSQSMAVEAAPTWKGIVETAEEHKASLIVLGSHRRSGLAGHLLGSVAAAVVDALRSLGAGRPPTFLSGDFGGILAPAPVVGEPWPLRLCPGWKPGPWSQTRSPSPDPTPQGYQKVTLTLDLVDVDGNAHPSSR